MNTSVILSAAKDHLEWIERRKMILRFAQDDMHFREKGAAEAAPRLTAKHKSSGTVAATVAHD